VAKKNESTQIVVRAPALMLVKFKIRGLAPYVQLRFDQKTADAMHEKHEGGEEAKNTNKTREKKDFQGNYERAMYKSHQGWRGLPASSFRNACISACRVAGVVMTKAKLSIFFEADGFDETDGTPLIKITKGKPHYVEHRVRNANGQPDLRARAMWDEGWEAMVTVRFDSAQFSTDSIANLLAIAGSQVGIGEGRPDSHHSNGMGWGLFGVA
jgi:hypothetical protein